MAGRRSRRVLLAGRVVLGLGLVALGIGLAACAPAAEETAPPEEEGPTPTEEAEPAEEEAAETATPPPTPEPTPPREYTPTPVGAYTPAPVEEVEVAFTGETAVSGLEAVTSGVLAVEDLGLGTVDATAPSAMLVGQSGTLRIEIAPVFDPEEVQVETYATVTAVSEPVEVLNFYDELRIYSIMRARLSAPAFDVHTSTPELQRLTADAPAIWVWNVIPRQPGRQSATASISVPIVIDGQVQEISTSPLRTIEFIIDVSAPPTPTPTPTPGLVARAVDQAGGEVVAAVILGVLGTVGTFLWRRITRRFGEEEKGK